MNVDVLKLCRLLLIVINGVILLYLMYGRLVVIMFVRKLDMGGKWNFNIIGLIVRLRRLLLMISRRIVFLVVYVLIVFLRIRLIRLRVSRLVRKCLLNLIWL